jgi:FlaA1/EpsC-like NDP-sugar epimerase
MGTLKDWKQLIIALIDISIIKLSYMASFYLLSITLESYDNYLLNMVAVIAIHSTTFYFFNLYNSLWTYAGMDELLLAVGGCLASGFLAGVYLELITDVPYVVAVIAALFMTMAVTGFLFSFRLGKKISILFERLGKRPHKRVLIIGAGSAGITVVNEINEHPDINYKPVGLIDDNKAKHGKVISGVKIYGGRECIQRVVKEKHVDEIIIAIPTLTGESKTQLLNICRETECRVRILPALYRLVSEGEIVSQIRDVDVEDLLGRDPVSLVDDGIQEYF